jgi:hypothetical protein
MRYQLLALTLLSILTCQNAVATPEIKKNSCRLYNAYMINGQIYSDADGIIINGEYPTASSETECREKCRAEQADRASSLPEIYNLKVECFYGQKSLYQENISPSSQ